MNKPSEAPLFFIYKNGFREISLPPINNGYRNQDVIVVTSCDDGVYITTEIDHKEAVEKLNKFKGRKIMEIHCDGNMIYENDRVFDGCWIKKGNYGEEVIYLSF